MIFLGKITKGRGNKGEVVIEPSPRFPFYSLVNGDQLILKSNKYERIEVIDYWKDFQGVIVCKFSSINSMNDAYRIISYSVFGTKNENPEAIKDYMIDFTVIDMEGQTWGTVKNLENYGTNQILEVKSPATGIIYVPFVHEIVKNIDQQNRIIQIDPPAGLKDLNQEASIKDH